MTDPQIALLLDVLDRAFDRRSWHGTNLRGSLRGLSALEASQRPAPGRHNIWELALHAAYWKYAVRRLLTGEKRGSFPLAGSNFFPRPEGEADERAWKHDLALLGAEHRSLRTAVAEFPAARLARKLADGRWTAAEAIYGIAAHDLYHAGQIQLLKRLLA